MSKTDKYIAVLNEARETIDRARLRAAEIKAINSQVYAEPEQLDFRQKATDTDIALYCKLLKTELNDLYKKLDEVLKPF